LDDHDLIVRHVLQNNVGHVAHTCRRLVVPSFPKAF
jgi:hypothetical protein